MNNITITLPEQPADQRQAVTVAETWAAALTIADADTRRQASAGVVKLKGMERAVKELFAPSKKAASDAHKAVCAAEKKLLAPIEAARRAAENKMLAYDAEQGHIRREAEAKALAEAEARADGERRRLAAIAARCKDEAKAEVYREAAAAVTAVPVPAAAAEKIDGETVRKVWRAELASLSAVISAAAAGDINAAQLLAFDQTAANKMASMFKRDGVVAGVTFSEVPQLAHRG
jgi:hypothetical protein